MKPEDEQRDYRRTEPPEDELREILEAAERRKQGDWNQKSRKFSWIIGAPIAGALIWAGVFLMRYEPETPGPQGKPSVAVSQTQRVLSQKEQNELAEYDSFRPKSERVGKTENPGTPAAGSGKLIDKDDIRFGMELLNFLQRPAKAEPKK